MARAESRRREFAVRAALGASRSHYVIEVRATGSSGEARDVIDFRVTT
jgi:hypothetical protein